MLILRIHWERSPGGVLVHPVLLTPCRSRPVSECFLWSPQSANTFLGQQVAHAPCLQWVWTQPFNSEGQSLGEFFYTSCFSTPGLSGCSLYSPLLHAFLASFPLSVPSAHWQLSNSLYEPFHSSGVCVLGVLIVLWLTWRSTGTVRNLLKVECLRLSFFRF